MPDAQRQLSVLELFAEFQDTGDSRSRERLLEHFAPLVERIAAQVSRGLPSGIDAADLIADGTVGLIGAIAKFEPGRGHPFQTYAAQRIRGAMIDGLRAADWVPRSIREKVRDVSAVVVELEQRHRRTPRPAEIAAELGITTNELSKLDASTFYTQVLSLDLNGWEQDRTPPSPHGVPGEDDGIPEGFAAAIANLQERDQVVIALYYWERLSLSEIGQVFGVSESRVSQLHHRATAAIRRQLIGEG